MYLVDISALTSSLLVVAVLAESEGKLPTVSEL